jgi:hypothetical protein
LQASRSVHDVAGDHGLAVAGTGVERHDRLAGVHGNPGLEVQLGVGRVELGERLPDRERGADGALCVVAVGERRAEDGHDRVADELLHEAAEPFDLDPKALVIAAEDGAHVLRVEGFRARCEADEVGEEDGDDAPFLVLSRSVGRECGSASRAEIRVFRALLAALRALRHGTEPRRPDADARSESDGPFPS